MISDLHIKNLGIIKDIDIEFENGLNVMTGETGAGKSLIIDALNLISGGRFSKEMIRKDEDNLEVELNIFLDDEKDDEKKNIVISRQISLNGKNICRINGKIVSVNELKNYMKDMIDLHLQNDNSKLLDKKNHIEFLDSYSEDIITLKSEYRKKYYEYLNITNELNNNLGDDKERKRTLDLYEYEINEITEANLTETEEEIEQKRNLIKNAGKVLDSINSIKNLLDENVLNSLEMIIKNYTKISDIDDAYKTNLNIVQNAYYDLKDISDSSEKMLDDNMFNEQEILEFEKRLDVINTLKRKYGNTIDEIIKYKENIELKVKNILNMDSYITSLKQKADDIKSELLRISYELNTLRINYGMELQNKINAELTDMEMKNAKLEINIDFDENRNFNENGQNNIEFLIKTNVGQDFMPLIKIASGGELSRIMLAIKTVLVGSYNTEMLILDEIDTGISGDTANKIAGKLIKLSNTTQILCVTHLPNIAAVANKNFYIYKENVDDYTMTKVKTLSTEEKTAEIARISFGGINEISLKYALELQRQKL